MTRGLTLGKYAPYHRGHQLVVETALAETDEVIVLVYDCPETTDVPLSVRAGWIRTLHPTVRVMEARGGPTEVGDDPEIRRRHEEYVIRDLGIRGVTHFYSSEFYGEHMARALGAVDRRVDPDRRRVPVRGRDVRRDPYEWREFLDPVVYRDLVTNVVLLGAPSTGKSTLAERLAREYDTVFMPEYGREYWAAHQVDRRLTPAQLVAIAEGHLEREEALLRRARRFLFTDTNALTTRIFALQYHGGADPRLDLLADKAAGRYDLVFLCDDDLPYEDTADRSGEGVRSELQRRTIEDLERRSIRWHRLSGDLEARVRAARAILDGHIKYRPEAGAGV